MYFHLGIPVRSSRIDKKETGCLELPTLIKRKGFFAWNERTTFFQNQISTTLERDFKESHKTWYIHDWVMKRESYFMIYLFVKSFGLFQFSLFHITWCEIIFCFGNIRVVIAQLRFIYFQCTTINIFHFCILENQHYNQYFLRNFMVPRIFWAEGTTLNIPFLGFDITKRDY